MADYIRGKKAYTKWDVDADNVDIDLPIESRRQRPQPKVVSPDCFTGPRGNILKVLGVVALILLGMVFGYLIRRGVHEMLTNHSEHASCGTHHSSRFSQFLQNSVDTDNLLYWLKNFSVDVHSAGSEINFHVAQMLSSQWKVYGLDTVKIEKFNVLLSQPSKVQVLDENGKVLFTASELGDSKSNKKLHPYSAFAPNKSVQGKLIYGNFGSKEDFKYLLSQNITINGSVVLLRNGHMHRGNKIQMASKYGAAAVILYSDPLEVVPSKVIPGLPGDGVVRGSLKTKVGDLRTEFLPSQDGLWKDPLSDIVFPSIPVQPIGYDDALALFRELSGPEAPPSWRGHLNISYNLAMDHNRVVSVEVHNKLVNRDIFNILGSVTGDCEPGRYVIIGCHYDSWAYGASDPNSGMAVLMELTRLFGLLKKEGWKPGRTLIFAAWDGEEQGMIGSTEWIQAHATELVHHAVSYINLDAVLSGNYTFMALASPILRFVLKEATSEVKCHEHPDLSLYDMWRRRRPRDPNSGHTEPDIPVPGSGSDFVSFMATYGISSAHIQFVDNSKFGTYPMYHTAYDTVGNLVKYVDPDMHIMQTLTRVAGVMLLMLLDSFTLPMRAEDYSDQLKRDLQSFKHEFGSILDSQNISLGFLDTAVESFHATCFNFHVEADHISSHDILALQDSFNRLIELDRCFILPPGVPGTQFRHTLYGPEINNVYNGEVFPLVHSAILKAQESDQEEDWQNVKKQLSYVINSLRNAIGLLKSQSFVAPH